MKPSSEAGADAEVTGAEGGSGSTRLAGTGVPQDGVSAGAEGAIRPSAPPEGRHAQAEPRRRTLPPPDWHAPRSVSGLSLEWLGREPPLARRRGPRAELATLRARLRAATEARDTEGERVASAALARSLAALGVELDLATKLARRSLLLGDDSALREELSTWFAVLGEPGLAAATLRPAADADAQGQGHVDQGVRRGRLLTRIAVFLGRHGDPRGASEAFSGAAEAAPSDPVPLELRGALAAWAPDALSDREAADSYLEAARRREAMGDKASAFEDLLRAFEAAPGYSTVAERLSTLLATRGRLGAADEILREHARAAGDRAIGVHRARLRDAAVDSDALRALGAAFDAGLDRGFDPGAIARSMASEDSAVDLLGFDRVLIDVGLVEIVAARIELAAEAFSGPARARVRVEEGRLLLGPIGAAPRAVEALIDAATCDPAEDAGKALLRQHAVSSGDLEPLVEALVRVGLRATPSPERSRCLRELVVLAEQRLADSSLALWAVRRLLEDDQRDEELRGIATRLAARVRQEDEALAAVRVQLETATGADRLPLLRGVAVALRGRPDEVEAYLGVLTELAEGAPEDRPSRQTLERILGRLGRTEAVAALFQRDLELKQTKAQVERARLGLARLARARGDEAAALDALLPLSIDGAVHRTGWAMAFALASKLGRDSDRATALARVATLAEPGLHALLASVASDIFLSAGDVPGARRAAEQACHADGSSPRSIGSLARATAGQRDRIAAVALERAAGVVMPRVAYCRTLADTYDALGEPDNALAWTQRWLAVRPGDREAGAFLLSRVTAAGDPGRIGDALGWLLAQPEPLTEIAPLVRKALEKLAGIDPQRGATLSRRALDVFGPRNQELRETVRAVAERVGDRGLCIAVLERRLAAGTPGHERAALLLDVSRLRRNSGDADGAARSLVRALAEGADAATVLAEIDRALPARTADGELGLLEGRAEALSALSSSDLEGVARAWRELGGARFDLADDRAGAVAAWERAAAVSGEDGLERLARDLVAFAGHAEAMKRLEDLANRRRGRREVARALSLAAGVALDGGLAGDALAIALRALEADSSRADVLGIAERAASPKDVEHLERAYEIVARGSLGIYGERAAHYRAARQLERRGFRERALGHAVLAFEAVPAEGVCFVLMMRLAERTGDSTLAVSAIERVATRARSAEERATWLRRAALVAGSGEEGKRQRVDVLLRALDANPHGETLRSLGAALADLVQTIPEEREIAELRFGRALRAMLPRLEGPEGARVAIEAARTAGETFRAPSLCLAALGRAADCDASVDEFTVLVPLAHVLAEDEAGARVFLARAIEILRSPYENPGPALVELGESVTGALGDGGLTARLVAAAALREPERTDLLLRAERLARAQGDEALLAQIQAAVPIEKRLALGLALSAEAEDDGDLAAAAAPLEALRGIERLPAVARTDVESRLATLYRREGRLDALEALLREAMVEAQGPDTHLARGRELVRVLTDTGRGEAALELVEELLEGHPGDHELLESWLLLARKQDDAPRQVRALSRLIDLQNDPAERLQLLRRLASLLVAEGDEEGALVRYRQILLDDLRDAEALTALERDADRRLDWGSLSDLLSRRAAIAATAEDARKIRLHRAEVLDQRLGRPEEARTELSALLDDSGDHLVVLTRLADLNERLGGKLRAAPLWLRASAIPKDRTEAGELARRACQAYLDGGDVESARRVHQETADHPRTPKLIALRVDIERRSENPRALSEALEEMALSSMEPPRVRANLLVEAARAALSGGQIAVALGQAERAARIAREAAEPQLFARMLEYRGRGAGTREEAASTVVELRAIREPLEPHQREVHAFLLAEALDVSSGEGEGMRELSKVHAELGPVPLVALGMAERLARGTEPDRALALFDAALDGDLRDLRPRGEVALAAAQIAERAREPDRALSYLEVAAAMPDTRARALGAQMELRTRLGRISDAPPPIESTRVHAAHADTQAADPGGAASHPGVHEEGASGPADPGHEEPVLELRSRRPEELVREPVIELRKPSEAPIELLVRRDAPSFAPAFARPSPSSVAPSGSLPPGSLRLSAPPKPVSRRPSAPAAASGPTTSVPPSPPRASVPSPRPAVVRRAVSGADEEALHGALAQGSIDAGQELINRLEARPDRTHELVGVCRRVAQLLPGDREVLERLHQATLADRNVVYARAVEHVLRAFDPRATPLPPPALSEQIEQPDRAATVLFRETWSPATEALGLVWAGASHLFRRDPSSYGVTGLERVAVSAPTPLARLFGGASRLLGMTRTPLFQRKSGEPVTINVALLSPPALLLTGEVKAESPALGYQIGAMLAATLPEHVLLYGAPEAQVANVLRALVVAFGPPQDRRSDVAQVGTFAEMLWESMPARSQRRLRELCDDPVRIDYDAARNAARQAVRRAGLFVSGDLAVAVRETCGEVGVSTWGLDAPSGLSALCTASPQVADLVRLATSPEYASARWQQHRGRQPSGTWGTV